MVDLDAAIGFVVAKGDVLDRARLSYLRTGATPSDDILAATESGQTLVGGWPGLIGGRIPSIDATCFRLAQLDDLGALQRPAARSALYWLASRQHTDGSWQEDEALAADAPPWAQPGDPEARLYLTANAAFWLTVADLDARPNPGDYGARISLAAQVIAGSIEDDGTWPSFLVMGWLGACVLYRQDMFYEAAKMQVVLKERVSDMSGADTAWLAACMRRVGVSDDDWTLMAAKRRLGETQRTDGGWTSDDGPLFDVNVTLNAIRAIR